MVHERTSSYSIPPCLQGVMESFCWNVGQEYEPHTNHQVYLPFNSIMPLLDSVIVSCAGSSGPIQVALWTLQTSVS